MILRSLLIVATPYAIAAPHLVQPIADRVAQHLEIVSKTFPTHQNTAQGIYD